MVEPCRSKLRIAVADQLDDKLQEFVGRVGSDRRRRREQQQRFQNQPPKDGPPQHNVISAECFVVSFQMRLALFAGAGQNAARRGQAYQPSLVVGSQ